MNELAGMKIIANGYLPTAKREQFRFPRSKKKRIRRKWAKQEKNFRWRDCTGDIYIIGGNSYVHPRGYAVLRQNFKAGE